MLMTRRLIVAITGASGVAFGVRLLEYLKAETDVETHLMVSPAGWLTIDAELDIDRRAVEALATRVYPVRDVGACVASGSFATDGMVVAPCSMRTLAAVAHGLSDNLITRAADVVLKERRRLVLLTRETPLNLAHLRNMTAVTEMGGIIFPPVPALYQRPGEHCRDGRPHGRPGARPVRHRTVAQPAVATAPSAGNRGGARRDDRA